MKKIKYLLISCSFVFLSVLLSFFYKVNAQNKILLIDSTNVSINKNVELTINLSSIEYNTSNIVLKSSSKIENVETNDTLIDNTSNNEIEFTYIKDDSSLNYISLSLSIPKNSKIGDKILYNIEISDAYKPSETINEILLVTLVEATNNNVKTNTNNKPSNISTNKTSLNKSFNTSKYNGTNNNYLSNLSIKGYSFTYDFQKDVNTYFVTIPSNVDKITINAKKDNSKSKVNISGNTNLKEGLNKVLITVTSVSGDNRYYRIFVTKEGASNE